MTKLKKSLISIIMCFIVIVALACIFKTPLTNKLATEINRHRDQPVTIAHAKEDPKFFEEMAKELAENAKAAPTPSYDTAGIDSVSDNDVYQMALDRPTLNQTNELAIPSAGIRVPIYPGLNRYNLMAGAGEQFPESTVRNGGIGNYVLASHNMIDGRHLFSNLAATRVGTPIYTTDGSNIYTYAVTSVNKVSAADHSALTRYVGDKREITLYTCGDLSATTRWVVEGVLTETKPLKDATPTQIGAFSIGSSTYSSWLTYYYARVL